MPRQKVSGLALFLVEALLVGSGMACLASCAEANADAVAPSAIDEVWVGFALNNEGRVTPGCVARTFSLHDPIHLSLRLKDAAAGSVIHVAVRNVVTRHIAWSEAKAVTPGLSVVTFELGRDLAVGRYRAESTLGGASTIARDFVVHERRPGVR